MDQIIFIHHSDVKDCIPDVRFYVPYFELFHQTFFAINEKPIKKGPFPARIYLFKVNNENGRAMCKICPKLILETPERRQFCKLLSVFTQCFGVSIAEFEK